ncbi:hypothetical protein [Gynuella sunshinyii]|uniref:Uncharacterized protein n=1 Tax=Gynuella sunshinyii YC6258 TaxID=1445510 RepID=A0A0C5V106_9GAMM|nr:hypothetical protein [Gynuella sunshinyii]AJQ93195.1 hypothetical Protein YC6258_01147 [Gynuella sunshinyii YC6258]
MSDSTPSFSSIKLDLCHMINALNGSRAIVGLLSESDDEPVANAAGMALVFVDALHARLQQLYLDVEVCEQRQVETLRCIEQRYRTAVD